MSGPREAPISPAFRRRLRLRRCNGQASVELIAGLPALILAGLLLFQLGAMGYAYTVVDGAAEAGALTLAAGGSPRAAARAALPSWARASASIKAGPTRVEVSVRPPSPLAFLADRMRVSSAAAVAGGGLP